MHISPIPQGIKVLRNRILCIRVFIILFSTGLYKSAFTTYSFGKLDYHLSVFFYVFCLFCILNLILVSSQETKKYLISHSGVLYFFLTL